MPFTVQHLIEDKPEPVSVRRSDSAKVALALMIENDYSQLPIITEDNQVDGIVTSDSIIRALNNFDLTIKELKVLHAYQSVKKTFRSEEDLFELLDHLKNDYAAIVVDNNKHIKGIVTNYDTTGYFRRRGEDIMWIEDIESMLKEYILAYFQFGSGEIDESALENAITEIDSSESKFKSNFKKAWDACVKTKDIDEAALDCTKIEETFAAHLNPKQLPKAFDKLTLYEYIEIFLNKKRWKEFEPIFQLSTESCRKMLEPIREIRNALAHFRADLTAQDREKLKSCKDWLARHQQEVIRTFSPKIIETDAESKDNKQEKNSASAQTANFEKDNYRIDPEKIPIQLISQPDANESKYAELAVLLQSLSLKENSVILPFNFIEKIIDSELPKTAREHRSWWANDSVGHVQSRQWLEAGWRVSNVNISQEVVTFSRIKGREQNYINFFSNLLADLKVKAEFPIKSISPSGRSYITLDKIVSNDISLTTLGFSFARAGRFRVELYIDSGDQKINEAVFNLLYNQRNSIEEKIGVPLHWESLSDRRASRIAAYHLGSITQNDSELLLIRKWATNLMIKFYKTFHAELRDEISEIANSFEK